MTDQADQNRRRALVLLVGFGAAIAVVLAVVLVAVGLGIIGLVLAILVGIAAAVAAQRTADGAVLKAARAQPADPTVHARLHNVVEGLCVANGLAPPTLHVIDDPALDALVAGRDPQHAHLVVTTGLLDALDRVELEGVLAHELSHVKSGDIAPATLAVTTVALVTRPLPGLQAKAVGAVLGAGRISLADASAVEMTRYPPGLIAALEKVEAAGSAHRPGPAAIAHLWLTAEPADATAPLDERIATLREL